MDTQLFKPSPELTFDTVQQDGKRLLALLKDNQVTSLCFDLTEVTQCDSAGLALLIEAKRLCGQYNTKLAIKGIPKAISALAEFCGVEQMLE